MVLSQRASSQTGPDGSYLRPHGAGRVQNRATIVLDGFKKRQKKGSVEQPPSLTACTREEAYSSRDVNENAEFIRSLIFPPITFGYKCWFSVLYQQFIASNVFSPYQETPPGHTGVGYNALLQTFLWVKTGPFVSVFY